MSAPGTGPGRGGERPGGAAPQRPDGAAPQRPDGEAPQRPDGEAPQRPDGEAPARPDGAQPVPPGGAANARPGEAVGALPRPIDAGAAAIMVMLCAVWGLGQIAIKVGNEGISPLWQAGLRSAGAAVVIAAWMAWRGIGLRPAPGTGGWALAIGVVFALEFVALYIGLSMTSAARGSVMLYTAPFFVAIGAHLLLGDRLSPARGAGLALAFGGVAVALLDRRGGAGDWTGDLLCLAAGFAWAVTTLIIKATPLAREPAERTLWVQLVVSAVLLLGASALVGEPGVFAPSARVWTAFAWQVGAVASFSYLGWFVMVQRHSPAKVSAFTFLTPLFGVGFAVLLLREPLTASLGVAAALIAVGIRLVNRR
jgi:drug/metabolite transporter (DMT)-like permease